MAKKINALLPKPRVLADSKLKIFNKNIPIIHTLLCEKLPGTMTFIRDWIKQTDWIHVIHLSSKMIITTKLEPTNNLLIIFPISEKLFKFFIKNTIFNPVTLYDEKNNPYYYNQIIINSHKKGTMFQKIHNNTITLNTVINFIKKNIELIKSIEHELTIDNLYKKENIFQNNVGILRKELSL